MDLTTEQLRQIIQEELEGMIAEDCWDGYKRNHDVPKGQQGSCELKEDELEEKKKKKSKKGSGGKRDGKGSKSKGYGLHQWFQGGGWVQAGGKYDGKPCAKQKGQKTKPYCRDPDDRDKLSKKEKEKRARKKRKEDPNPNRRGKAKNVSQKSKRKKKK